MIFTITTTTSSTSGKEEILIAELCPFVKCHTRLTYLGLVLTDTCKEEMFTDLSHEDFNQALGNTSLPLMQTSSNLSS